MWRVSRRHATAAEHRDSRLLGVLLYAAVVAVAWGVLPATLPFVVPSAAFGAAMHAGPRRPWLGFVGFWVLLVVVPAVFFPSLLVEAFFG